MFRLALVALSLCCLASGLALAEPLVGPTISGFNVTEGAGGFYTIDGTVEGADPSITVVEIRGALGNHEIKPGPDGRFHKVIMLPGASGLVSGTPKAGGVTGPAASDDVGQ